MLGINKEKRSFHNEKTSRTSRNKTRFKYKEFVENNIFIIHEFSLYAKNKENIDASDIPSTLKAWPIPWWHKVFYTKEVKNEYTFLFKTKLNNTVYVHINESWGNDVLKFYIE